MFQLHPITKHFEPSLFNISSLNRYVRKTHRLVAGTIPNSLDPYLRTVLHPLTQRKITKYMFFFINETIAEEIRVEIIAHHLTVRTAFSLDGPRLYTSLDSPFIAFLRRANAGFVDSSLGLGFSRLAITFCVIASFN